MLISLSHRFVFLCNRKCASVSIESMLRRHSDILLLGPPGFRHTNYRLYSRYIAPYIEAAVGDVKLETICVVREPLSWLYSFYRFRSRYELRDPGNPNHDKSTCGISFPQFVTAYMQPDPPPYADIGCQFDIVRDERNRIGVDRLFPYDAMEHFIGFMSRKTGHALKIGHKNMSPKRNRQLRAVAMMDRAVKTATSVFNLKRVAAMPAARPQLPDDVLASAKEFLHADFALYEHACAPDPGAEKKRGLRPEERNPRVPVRGTRRVPLQAAIKRPWT